MERYSPKYRQGIKPYLEDVKSDLLNTDKETKLRDHRNKITEYNNKKNSFVNIIKTKKPETWEIEAQKVINGNPYLGIKWKLDKLQNTVEDSQLKMKSNDVTIEEKKKIEEQLKKDLVTLAAIKQDITKTMAADLQKINKL